MINMRELFFKANLPVSRLIGCLLIFWLLAACSSAPQTASPDVSALSTQAVATVYANLTLSPAVPTVTPTPSLTPLPPTITDKFDVPMVLVPGGPFLMGRDKTADNQPYLEATIGSYYIDTYEVTNQRYQACVHAGVCKAPYNQGSFTHASYYLNPDFANYPVLLSGLDEVAETYCTWRGAHIPTVTEWEKALRGPDGRSYPWGNTDPDGTRANLCDANCYQSFASTWLDDGYADVAPVGSFPAGASPYGVMDLVGNVNEIVAVERQPVTPAPAYLTLGGAYDTNTSQTLRESYIYASQPAWFNIGFRCASGPVGEPVTPVFKPLRPTGTPAPTPTPLPTATIAPAAISANVYPIAFLSKASDESMHLQLVNDDGSGLRTLFPLGQDLSFEIRQPTWSPDGKSLFFIGYHNDPNKGVNQQHLYQAEPAETDPLKVYHGVTGLPDLAYEKMAISPDGRYLALVYRPIEGDEAYLGGGEYGFPALGLFDLKTNSWKTLLIPNRGPDLCLSPAAWAPGSRQFTFSATVKNQTGFDLGGISLISNHLGGGYDNADLFVVNSDGIVKRISQESANAVIQCPVWATAGKQIIFVAESLSLLVINPDGSQRDNLNYLEQDYSQFWLAPTGMRLAMVFTSSVRPHNQLLTYLDTNSHGVYGYDGQGEGVSWDIVLAKSLSASSLAWSPDGSRMAFQCAQDTYHQICLTGLDGTGPYILTGEETGSFQPSWSPDGLKIAFSSATQTGATGLYVINTDGRGLLRLTDLGNAGGEDGPQAFFWAPRAVTP